MRQRLRDALLAKGITLPTPSSPGANYRQDRLEGRQLFITGQLAQWNGERRYVGKLGREFGLEEGQQAARLAALNLLAHLDRVLERDGRQLAHCLRIGVYVNATGDFLEHSQVANGASDLFLEALGEAGQHTRMAIGVSGLPYGVAIEVEGLFALTD